MNVYHEQNTRGRRRLLLCVCVCKTRPCGRKEAGANKWRGAVMRVWDGRKEMEKAAERKERTAIGSLGHPASISLQHRVSVDELKWTKAEALV